MANGEQKNTSLTHWNREVGKVSVKANEVDAKIAITEQLEKNEFKSLSSLIDRINKMESMITKYVELANQEANNMITAATQMQKRDRSERTDSDKECELDDREKSRY